MAEKVEVPAGMNAADVQAGLELLRKTREQRTKQRDKIKNDPVAKAKADARAFRLRVKNTLMVKKALAAGISVTDAEIDAEIAAKPTA